MKERILIFIKYLEISNTAFEKNVGLSNGFINNIGENVREKTLLKISSVYPQLNTNWWKTGEGKMVKSEFNSSTSDRNLENDANFITISYNEFQQILRISEGVSESLKVCQSHLSDCQTQIRSLLDILKKK